MLRTVQYIALVQGIFLLIVLLRNKKRYRKPIFWLFFGCLASVVLFIIGDDENNLFFNDLDLFLLDSSLFVTFLFLLFKYRRSDRDVFQSRDLAYFLPNFVYLGIESSELLYEKEFMLMEVLELLTELTFLIYLLYIFFVTIRMRTRNWIFYFTIPLVIIMGLNYAANIRELVLSKELILFGYEEYDSYLLLLLAFLFFFVSFKLIENPSILLPKIKNGGYNNSKLKPALISQYEQLLLAAMEKEKIFMNQKLSIHEVSEKVGIPRRYISEVLNHHMHISFQDFVNRYRIQEFIERLQNKKYQHYSLYGLATEVGFTSKSTFNATFKRITGLTPLSFKNKMSLRSETSAK